MNRLGAFLIACLAIFAASDAVPQVPVIAVRAGEHQDYTRLILQLPEDAHWRLHRSSVSARLEFAGPPLEFNLTQTFSRIPRTRLRDIRAIQGGLDLYIGCDCDIEAREDIPQFLIIDIIGERSHTVYAPMTAPRPPARTRVQPHTELQVSGDPQRAGVLLARALRGGTSAQTAPSVPALNNRLHAAYLETRDTESEANAAGEMPQRSLIAKELGRVLASSVSSGILDPVTALSTIAQPARGPAREPKILDQDPDAHLAVVTRNSRQATSEAAAADQCPEQAMIDPSKWFSPAELSESALYLQDLYSALDHAQHDQIINYSRHLIYLGFGAEARMVLELLPAPDNAAKLLSTISYLVDISDVPSIVALPELRDCGPMGSLWAFLADRGDVLSPDFPIDNLVRAIQLLPAHLRLHLGPIIVQRLAGLGQMEQARIIRASLDRIAQQESSGLTLARATLDLADATPEQARMLETTLAPDNSDEELLFLLSRRDARGEALEGSLKEAALSRLFALRATPAGREIASLVTRAMAREGEFRQAFDLLAGREASLEAAQVQSLHATIFERLSTHANDTDFVTLVFEQRPWEMTYLPARLQQELASRMRLLGFEPQADLLDTSQHTEAHPTRPDEQTTDMLEDVRDLSVNAQQMDMQVAQHDRPGAAEGQMINTEIPQPTSDAPVVDPDILRARSAQSAQRNLEASLRPNPTDQENTLSLPEPAGNGAAQDTRQPEIEEGFSDVSEQAQSTPGRAATRTGGVAEQGTALLSQSRDALGQSAVLRERLQALLEDGIQR